MLSLLVLVGTLALSSQSNRVPLESHQLLPHQNGWKYLAKADPADTVTLVMALKQQNLETISRLLDMVSDPRSPHYGRYLTIDQVSQIVRPKQSDVEKVLGWVESAGRVSCETVATGDFIKCTMSVKSAERLLETEFGYFEHEESLYAGEHVVITRAVREYSVPSKIARMLDFIGGVLRVPNVSTRQQPTPAPTEKDFRYGVHPDTLRKRYNVSENVGSNPDNVQATAQFLNQHYSAADLKEFMRHFGKGFSHLTEISKVIGPNSGKPGLEANLDVQYLMSLGSNITTVFWSTGGLHEKQEPFLEWAITLTNTTNLPHVFSVSYGDVERSLSPEYMTRINTEFQKLGLRGISVLFASGDDGAGCHNFNDTAYTFEPQYPASSPYVTTVGGTQFTAVFSDVNEEGNDISGGGFSNQFAMPKWQQEAVGKYLNTSKLPDAKYFNPKMRAYPDVSAMSDDFWIIIDRLLMNVAGTSAATPTVAGLVSMANDARLNAGKPVLGFLNPFIYQNPQIFFDVTLGSPSQACWLDDLEGYPVTEGWDPVTGFGTPDYNKLVAAAMQYYN